MTYSHIKTFANVIKGKVGSIRTSGKFGHTFANSVNPDETAPYDPSYQDFHCLLSYFIVIPIFEILNKQGFCPNLAVCPNIPDFTLEYRLDGPVLYDLYTLGSLNRDKSTGIESGVCDYDWCYAESVIYVSGL